MTYTVKELRMLSDYYYDRFVQSGMSDVYALLLCQIATDLRNILETEEKIDWLVDNPHKWWDPIPSKSKWIDNICVDEFKTAWLKVKNKMNDLDMETARELLDDDPTLTVDNLIVYHHIDPDIAQEAKEDKIQACMDCKYYDPIECNQCATEPVAP